MDPKITRNKASPVIPDRTDDKNSISQKTVMKYLSWKPGGDQRSISDFRIKPLDDSDPPEADKPKQVHLTKRKQALLTDVLVEDDDTCTHSTPDFAGTNMELLVDALDEGLSPAIKNEPKSNPPPKSREQAWEKLRLKAQSLARKGVPVINTVQLRTELRDWLTFVPMIINPEKTVDILVSLTANFGSPANLMEAIKNFIAPFNGAREIDNT